MRRWGDYHGYDGYGDEELKRRGGGIFADDGKPPGRRETRGARCSPLTLTSIPAA